MKKRVLNVGQCGPDTHSLTRFLTQHFDVEIVSTKLPADTLAALRGGDFALVLINRKLDEDYTDGLEILKAIKADAALAAVPAMLVSNYPEAHDEAMACGGERGFGKLELNADTAARLRPLLG